MTAPDHRKSTPAETARDPGARLPHDHDESARPEAQTPQRDENRAIVRQAHEDVERGLVDTERIGTPSDVPSANGKKRA